MQAAHFLSIRPAKRLEAGFKEVGGKEASKGDSPMSANQAANKPAGPTSISCIRGEATVKFSFVDFIFPFGTYAYFALVLGTLWVGRIYSVT